MAYFSDVLFICNEDLNEEFCSVLEKLPNDNWLKHPIAYISKNGLFLRYYERIKYRSMDEGERQLQLLLSAFEDDKAYRYIKIGEQYDDIEYQGLLNDETFNSSLEVNIYFDRE